MAHIELFDPAMCCSSGVCGVSVEQALVDIAADLQWLKAKGVDVQRFNLAQAPLAFAERPAVAAFLQRSGEEGLPLVMVDGEVALAGRYPKRTELARWAGIAPTPVAIQPAGACAPKSGCC